MGDSMEFASREAFRSWLSEHGQSSAGVWLLFGKAGGPKTLKAGEALEEALCFGWIDGQMQRIDEKSYRKYFSQRRDRSKWSEKNKALVQVLEERGLMTDLGRAKVEEAKRNGQWYAPNPMAVTEEQIAQLSALLEGLIEQRKKDVLEYEKYLQKIVELCRKVHRPEAGMDYPENIRNSAAKRAFYDYSGGNAELAEKLHEAVLASRQDCFRGNKVKERKIKRAIEAVIKDKGQAEELLALVRGQREY